MIVPGQTIGIFGGGQLGRMSAIAARQMGYGVAIYEPAPSSPAGAVADLEINARYDDLEAVDRFLAAVDVVTYEFENVPTDTIRHAIGRHPLNPSAQVLHICQNREREKTFLRNAGIPHAGFEVVASADDLLRALDTIGVPCVLKTADFGYDGKGQLKITEKPADPSALWDAFGCPRGVIEAWIPFEKELSVIIARNGRGESAVFPVGENIHTDHILDLTIVPARIPDRVVADALSIGHAIADQLELTGLLAIEMFLTESGDLLVNELAPRPHNSGHYTIDACATSQFEQHVRSVCDLPLGSTDLLIPAVMVNILGQTWSRGQPDWTDLLAEPGTKLHLYGKREARTGRKMGHFCVLSESLDDALDRATRIRANIRPSSD